MSWFDVTGVTTFAKSALKEAQRTIDKALDIDENQENATPTSTPTSTPSSISTPQTPSVSSEKIKQQSEDFFAAFGLTEKKKSPLTPSNSVVDSTQETRVAATSSQGINH
ncbi:unnamed protein product [Meganyctiphanes norvegica]|uniref:Uncharacterized protein n=1 Tax=Meganyctiphanes norvegica TaxID=48144 RepID=A0AAV2RX84_MEGNR